MSYDKIALIGCTTVAVIGIGLYVKRQMSKVIANAAVDCLLRSSMDRDAAKTAD